MTHLKISTRGRYGLRALVDIAANDGDSVPTALNAVAERQGISEHYLEQLIAPLKKQGIVQSVRGAQGGYRLNRPPDKIPLSEILLTLEGSLYPVDCLSDSEHTSCGTGGCAHCVTKPVWAKIYDSINAVLSNITLQDLVNDYKGKEDL